jgi:hypothetical protein
MKTKLLMFTIALVAATTFGAPSVLRKSGDCKLQIGADSFDDSKAVKVELANVDVEVTANFRGGEFFDEFHVFANPTIKNKSGKKLNIAYQAAFFDKSGELIACVAQSGDLDAGESGMQFGSAMSKLPQVEFSKITSYKVVIYVDAAKAKK